LVFIEKILKPLKLPFVKKSDKKSSKLQALERLKEIQNADYTSFVANENRAKSWIVWEYSKEKNLSQYPLNLVVKREKDVVFIQCRSNMKEVTMDNLMEFQKVGEEFIVQYPPFRHYSIFYHYSCSEHRFTDEALKYIESKEAFSYEILKEHS
jgi:hypothetical protein